MRNILLLMILATQGVVGYANIGASETDGIVTTITAEDIQRLQINSLTGEIRHASSIVVSNFYGVRTTFSHSEGVDHGKRIPILLNGVEIRNSIRGQFSPDLAFLAMDEILKIEVTLSPTNYQLLHKFSIYTSLRRLQIHSRITQ